MTDKNPLATNAVAVEQRKMEFAQYIGMNFTIGQAGKAVGLTGSKEANAYFRDPDVQVEIERIHKENLKALKIKREDVQAIVLEAIDMGRMISDPMAIIRGAQELNKMCGFYAPEEKKITLTTSQKRLVQKYDNMSDEDLAIAAASEGDVIEGEFEEVGQ